MEDMKPEQKNSEYKFNELYKNYKMTEHSFNVI